MDYPHAKREAREYGYSPGNGISPMKLSMEPLASEEEVDANMPDRRGSGPSAPEPSLDFLRLETKRDPTAGDDDPYAFDDVGDGLAATLPTFEFGAGDGPRF